MVMRREERGGITVRRRLLLLQHQHLLLLQQEQLSARTFLGDFHVALHGILAAIAISQWLGSGSGPRDACEPTRTRAPQRQFFDKSVIANTFPRRTTG